MNAPDIIRLLDLKPLPEEGGYYKEIFRAEGKIPGGTLPNHSGERSYCTIIYYLVTPTEFSGLHKVRSDEIFHFLRGDPVEMVQIADNGRLTRIRIGFDLPHGLLPHVVVPAGVWQGTKLTAEGAWALLVCTVAPGFEFADFEGGSYDRLSRLFPQHKEIIRTHTHR
ncbi:MAG: cupin domain-containing protein [Pseudomonadota bacterium]